MIDTPFFSPLNSTSPRAGQLRPGRTSAVKSAARTALLTLTFATILLAGCNDKKSAGINTGVVPTDQSGEHEGGDDQGSGMMGGREGRYNGEMDTTHRSSGNNHRGMMHRGMGKGQKHMGM
jgi:hypothetical protein